MFLAHVENIPIREGEAAKIIFGSMLKKIKIKLSIKTN